MSRTKKVFNPFYGLLLLVGIAFVVSACTYGVMTIKRADPHTTQQASSEGHALIDFMDQHGVTVLAVEIAILAVATFAAIGTDDYWARRAAARRPSDRGDAVDGESA